MTFKDQVKQLYLDTIWFFSSIIEKKDLIVELARRDIKRQYMGSYLGAVWVIIEPVVFIFILWFVFSIGFRGGKNINNAPFIVYLSTGIVSWQYFSATFSTNTLLIKQYDYLVKKVNFRLSILPIVKILSGLVPHTILLLVVFIIAVSSGVYPVICLFQVFYYMFAMMVLLLGLGWLTSALNVFVGDTEKIVRVLVQFGFWLTPIFWNFQMVSPRYQMLFRLNPMFYIVSGYRDSIIYHTPFWQKPYLTLYYWCFTSFVLLLGAVVFKRLRPHFAEVI